MTTVEPRPLTWTDHPACIQVLDEVIDQVDMIGAFRHAAQTLRPDNFDRRGILWLPKPNPKLDAEIAAQAAAGSKAYFNDISRFSRSEIFAELSRPYYECRMAIPDMGQQSTLNAEMRGDFVQLRSTTHHDYAFAASGGPHIDGTPVGSDPAQHHIRALHYTYASDPKNIGSLLYAATIHEHDINDVGDILKPDPFLGRPGTDKLGPAWQNTVRGGIFFMNSGGPVECQIAHDARPNFVDPHTKIAQITRHLDRYDFRVR